MGSSVEENLISFIVSAFGNKKSQIIPFISNNILETLSLIKTSSCVVSACSSALHLTSLTGVNSIGLYGPTDFVYTGPYVNNCYEINKKLKCSPCYHLTATGCGNPICMEKITVKEVYNKISDIIKFI